MSESASCRAQQLLLDHPLFRDCSPDALATALHESKVVDVQARAVLVGHDEPMRWVYILCLGTCVLTLRSGTTQRLAPRHVSAPTLVGASEVLAGLDRSLYRAEASSVGTFVAMSSASFLKLVEKDGVFGRRLLVHMARQACGALVAHCRVYHALDARLADLLLDYADAHGRASPRGVRIALPITRQDLAQNLGVAVRSVSRVLGNWRRQGWITSHKGWYVIQDAATLQELRAELQ